MKLVIIIGPPAVGKMTVGQALEKITDLKLFHNHMSIELVLNFFPFDAPGFSNLVNDIRFSVFREVAKSDLEGLIFTLVWDFDCKEDEEFVDEIIAVFKERDAKICLVELSADLEKRLERNRHEDRLAAKPSKRDVEWSEKVMLYHEKEYRMNSREGEFNNKKILRINNTNLSPDLVAQKIKDHFSL